MTGGISDLTEKEKEALRLLLAGHDAKSSAAELDISVHTVNDRLRNARQKIGVSSSREAARILGDAEGQTPKNATPTSLGISASESETHTAGLTNTKPGGPFGLTWLAGGMLIMSLVIAAAIVGVVYFADDAATVSASQTQERPSSQQQAKVDEPASLASAQEFLRFVDAGDWPGSWDAAGRYFQSQVTAVQWSAQVEPVRAPLGKVNSRVLSNVDRASSLPGAPEGEYEVLQFQTNFSEMKGGAIETVVMIQGESGWEVIGFFIRPASG
ncbi:DUF4019 domain-containing protein [Altererythrobacter sp. GH1-8]|uniref:DUF4019 domain-containing protein n=1 Tax=Altererythrobacter sp. GH1-8 TaxID=3349333 RepID=UPI00374D1AB1